MKHKRLSADTKHKMEGYVFISPFIVGFLLFFISPIFRSLELSFSNIVKMIGISETALIGFDHYIDAFVKDIEFVPTFLKVIRDTLINTPLILIFSLIIAIMINKNIKGKGFFRVIFFLPFLLGTGYVIKQLLGMGIDQMAVSGAKDILLPNEIKSIIGSTATDVLSEFMSRITLVLWKCGVQIIIFLSGLQGISHSLYESARCDSATEWDIFWKITLPMMSPIIFLNMIYTIVDSFNDSNNAMVNYFIDTSFKKNEICYASAISWIYFVFIALLLSIIFIVMGRIVKNTVGQKV